MGSFPHRRVLNDAASVYKSKEFDEQMAARLTNVQQKLYGIQSSRKVRFDELNSWPQPSRSDFYA